MNDQARDYERAGLQGSLTIDGPLALLVVDPVQAYTNPECPLYAGVEKPVQTMRRVLNAARNSGVPVVVTRVEHDPSGRNGGVFARKVPALRWFGPDSPYGSYIQGLEPAADDIEIVKHYPSAFAHTSLSPTLTTMKICTVIIVGLTTSGCIRATATDAMQHGFVPIVVSDAVGDRLPGPHEANLFDIRSKIGEVLEAPKVIKLIQAST